MTDPLSHSSNSWCTLLGIVVLVTGSSLKHAYRHHWLFIVGLLVVTTPVTAQESTVDNSHEQPDAAVPAAVEPLVSDEPSRELVTEKFVDEWLFYQADAAEKTVWSIQQEVSDVEPAKAERVLMCSGAVKGFAYTKEKYENFELTLEWRFPKDESGNSGVLVFTQAEPRIWPTSVQVQLHQPSAGTLIASGEQKFIENEDAEPDLARPMNQWNECQITCVGGDVSVRINGKKAGRLKGATPQCGSIALQSEGAEVHFRRLRLRSLPRQTPPGKSHADPPHR